MARKNETLSEFLTGKRASITPEMAGVAATGPRRVAGLRREEVASLAGVSVDWYARLEQGRPVTPSEQVLAAIARVLLLDDAETEYLMNLARPAGGRAPQAPPSVRPGVQRMIAQLDNQPAFVLGPRMEVLAGNELAWALLTDFPSRAADDRNLLRWLFIDPDARELYLEWDAIASDLVGVLQLEASARPRDPQIVALVEELAAVSQEFRAWWAEPRPQGRTSGTKHFHHPVVGALTIDWEAFTLPDDATQTLFVYTGTSHGFDIAISGQSERAHTSAEQLRELGVDAWGYQGDASTYDGVEGFWTFVTDLDRPVEAAALNVGITRGGAFVDNDLAGELRLIAINITGTVHMAKRVVQHMVPNGRGRILVVSSVSATTPTPYETVYGPSKAFGFSFAESLREELRGTGVTVTALLPGATDSDFHANAGMGNTLIGQAKKNDKTLVAQQGFEALMNDDDHVVGGDERTKQEAIDNRTTPEPVKAAHLAQFLRPRGA